VGRREGYLPYEDSIPVVLRSSEGVGGLDKVDGDLEVWSEIVTGSSGEGGKLARHGRLDGGGGERVWVTGVGWEPASYPEMRRGFLERKQGGMSRKFRERPLCILDCEGKRTLRGQA